MPPMTVSAVIRRRNHIYHELASTFLDVVPQAEEFRDLVELVRQTVHKQLDSQPVFESCRYLLGRRLSKPILRDLAWRLSGNYERLLAGKSVLPWSGQLQYEWMPLQITEGSSTKINDKVPGYQFRLRILAGSACPMVTTRSWSRKELGFLSTLIGYTKIWGKMPYEHPMQFVGMRLAGLFEPVEHGQRPSFYAVKVPSSLHQWNVDLLKKRYKIDPCPNGWDHACHQCVIGYDQCPAGVHPMTFVSQYCPRCKKQEALFDPAKDRTICESCWHHHEKGTPGT